MEGEAAEFQDWELLVNSDSEVVNSPKSGGNLDDIEAHSGGMIRSDYFSLENDNRYAKPDVVGASEEDSVESDNPSWIDPGPETQFQRRNTGEFWSDSGSDRSDDRKFSDFDVKNDLGFMENVKTNVGFEEIEAKDADEGKLERHEGNLTKFEGKSELSFGDFRETRSKSEDVTKFWSDSGGDNLVFSDLKKVNPESAVAEKLEGQNISEEENTKVVAVEARKPGSEEEGRKEARKPDAEEGGRKLVWWRVPFELLKYCLFKVSPVWSFSMAAAVMGFVILGRKLYRMKRKTQGLELKVTVDDKKVSQFMSRAARLNEAFSVVRRVPIARPLLPAAGGNPWPVTSLIR